MSTHSPTDLERLLKQSDPRDAASIDALIAGLARSGYLGARRGTRIECQLGAIAWIPADSPFVLTGGPTAVLVTLPAMDRPIEVIMGLDRAERARMRLAEALERLVPVVTWRELLADE